MGVNQLWQEANRREVTPETANYEEFFYCQISSAHVNLILKILYS